MSKKKKRTPARPSKAAKPAASKAKASAPASARAGSASPASTGASRPNPHPLARKTSFQPGQSGNPAGRTKGSRNVLCAAFIRDLAAVWHETKDGSKEARGIEALRKLADERPTAFVTAVGNLVPREFDLGDKSQSSFRQLWSALASGKIPAPPADEEGEPA